MRPPAGARSSWKMRRSRSRPAIISGSSAPTASASRPSSGCSRARRCPIAEPFAAMPGCRFPSALAAPSTAPCAGIRAQMGPKKKASGAFWRLSHNQRARSHCTLLYGVCGASDTALVVALFLAGISVGRVPSMTASRTLRYRDLCRCLGVAVSGPLARYGGSAAIIIFGTLLFSGYDQKIFLGILALLHRAGQYFFSIK